MTRHHTARTLPTLALATGFLLATLMAARPAGAQTHAVEPPATAERLAPDDGPLAREAARGRYFSRVGLALTVPGVGLTALGAGLMFLPGWSGVIAGGTLAGAGGVLALVGIPIWVNGAARRSLALATDRERLGRSWQIAGIAVTASGLAIAAAGAVSIALAAMGLAAQNDSAFVAGVTLLPLGGVVSLVIGVPMWVEPSRALWRLPAQAVASTGGGSCDPFAGRWTTQRFLRSLPPAAMVSAPVLAF